MSVFTNTYSILGVIPLSKLFAIKQTDYLADLIIMENQYDRYRLAVDAAEFGVWEYDVVNKVVSCSSIVRTMLGYPAYKTIENLDDFELFIAPQDVTLFRQSLMKHVEEYAPLSVDLRMLKKAGGIKWISLRGGFQIGQSGSVERVSALVIDIDKYKRAEHQVSQITAVLNQA